MRIVKETLEETFIDLIGTSLKDNELEISPYAETYVIKIVANLSSLFVNSSNSIQNPPICLDL